MDYLLSHNKTDIFENSNLFGEEPLSIIKLCYILMILVLKTI